MHLLGHVANRFSCRYLVMVEIAVPRTAPGRQEARRRRRDPGLRPDDACLRPAGLGSPGSGRPVSGLYLLYSIICLRNSPGSLGSALSLDALSLCKGDLIPCKG